jgi:protein subunit release factor B
MSLFIEIKAGEGGNHSKRLVERHLSTYIKVGNRNCL